MTRAAFLVALAAPVTLAHPPARTARPSFSVISLLASVIALSPASKSGPHHQRTIVQALSIDNAFMHVLVVDDNPADIFRFEAALATAAPDADLTTCQGGQEAIDYLRADAARPDLVLLDLNMPGLNGFDVLRSLGTLDPRPAGRVLAFTTSNAEVDRQQALGLGADGFITKPLGFDAMTDLIAQTLLTPA